jgi:predicted HNH restriction endonuclease
MALAAELPCQACGKASEQLHHPRSLALGCGMGLKAPHTAVIPLCFRCHEEFHRLGRRTWEAKYGTQAEMVGRVRELVADDGPHPGG